MLFICCCLLSLIPAQTALACASIRLFFVFLERKVEKTRCSRRLEQCTVEEFIHPVVAYYVEFSLLLSSSFSIL